MSENPLLSFFIPTDKIKELRPNQITALNLIWAELEKGVTKLTVSAPLGSGKTLLADILFNYYISQGKKCLYCSPLNSLVDQVEESKFEGVATLRGRSTYPCLVGKQDCSEGFCQSDKCPSKRKRDCRNKPYDTCKICICWSCIYKGAFKKFRESSKGNTNFSLMLLGVDNSPDVIVLDECLHPESIVLTEQGDVKIKDLQKGDKIYSYNKLMNLQIVSWVNVHILKGKYHVSKSRFNSWIRVKKVTNHDRFLL